LRRAGVDFVILEKEQQVGSSWRRHYERLHLHTIKRFSSLPFVPFPKHYPRYVPRNLMIEYLDGYAAKLDLRPRFGEMVRSVRRQGDGWAVTGASTSFHAPFVVVASGYNAEPVRAPLPGSEKFKGEAIHSMDYQNGKRFAGRSVLVVGMGNTGAEIALDLCEAGAHATISLRDGVHIVPRDLFGVPIQVAAMLATKLLPLRANDMVFRIIFDLLIGDLSRFGITRPRQGILQQIRDSAKIPVIDVGTAGKICQSAIKIAPGIAAIGEDGVYFNGGSKGNFDTMIVATGYRPNYRSFLDVPEGGTIEDVVVEGMGKSGIYFVGFRNVVTGLLREISREAVRVADDVARRRRAH